MLRRSLKRGVEAFCIMILTSSRHTGFAVSCTSERPTSASPSMTPTANCPKPLRKAIVQDCLWAVEFSLHQCGRYSDVADVYNATGCLTRAAQYMVHALFALLNSEYFVGDKHARRLIDQVSARPHSFTSRLAEVLAHCGGDSAGLRRSTETLSSLWLEIVELTAGAYLPRFRLR